MNVRVYSFIRIAVAHKNEFCKRFFFKMMILWVWLRVHVVASSACRVPKCRKNMRLVYDPHAADTLLRGAPPCVRRDHHHFRQKTGRKSEKTQKKGVSKKQQRLRCVVTYIYSPPPPSQTTSLKMTFSTQNHCKSMILKSWFRREGARQTAKITFYIYTYI